jgi:hypothetical protein
MIYRNSSWLRILLALFLAMSLLASAVVGIASAAGSVTLSRTSGPPCTLVTLSGSGFSPYDTIWGGEITFAGSPWNSDMIQIDSCGNWNISLRVPCFASSGPNIIVVKSTGNTTVSRIFTVTVPPITLSPTSGPPYTLVTIVGSSFCPLDTIPVGGIKFDGVPWNSETIPIDGSGDWATSLRVPLTTSCCGGKVVSVTSTCGTVSKSIFTITSPVVTLKPSSGPIGTQVIICVTNMTPDGSIPVGGITFDGTPWNTSAIGIDSTGQTCSVSLTVPKTSVGTHQVVINDSHLLATTNFTITQPSISVTPASAYKGDTVTVKGSGWPQQTPGSVRIAFAGANIQTATPGANGGFSVQFTVPLSASAINLISASDALGNTAPAITLTLNPPGLTLSPTSGLPYSTLIVKGVGFQPYSSVDELKFGTFNVLSGVVTTNNVGSFTTTFNVPMLVPGGYTVTARVLGVTQSACYMLQELKVTPTPVEIATPIGGALQSINDKLIIMWGYHDGVWQMYDPNDIIDSTLTVLVHLRGYWINVSDDCTLWTRELIKGWNLIAYY